MSQRLIHFLVAVLTALASLAVPGGSIRAAAPQSYANGIVRTLSGSAQFTATLDGSQTPAFELMDSSGGQTRTITLAEATEVVCLGQLFGGQTVSLTGTASDSSAGGERLEIQVFLVDGGAGGADRLSVKVRRGDDRVLYFLPMRDIETGDVWVSC